MRKLMLSGRIVADAQKQVTTNGHEYITFRLGNNEYNDEKNSEGKPITYWFRVTSFNTNHINLAKYLTKGKPVIVVGNYKDNVYQNNKTGNCEIGRDIILDSLDFINDGNGNNSQNNIKTQKTTSTTAIPEVTSAVPKTQPQPTAPVNTAVNDDDDDLPF